MIFLGALIGMLIFLPVGFMLGVYGICNSIDKAAKTESGRWSYGGTMYEIHEVRK
jgi:F0F1-type ATP synthase assembly protein I